MKSTFFQFHDKSLEWSPNELGFWNANIITVILAFQNWTSLQRLLYSKMLPLCSASLSIHSLSMLKISAQEFFLLPNPNLGLQLLAWTEEKTLDSTLESTQRRCRSASTLNFLESVFHQLESSWIPYSLNWLISGQGTMTELLRKSAVLMEFCQIPFQPPPSPQKMDPLGNYFRRILVNSLKQRFRLWEWIFW